MSFCLRIVAFIAAVASFPSDAAFGQSIVPSGTSGAAAPAARESLKFGADYQLASWMAADLNVAQSLSDLAQQKGSRSTQEFAMQSSRVRAKWVESLKPFLGDDVRTASPQAVIGAEPASAANSTATPNANRSPPTVSMSEVPAFDLVSLKRTLAEEALTATRRDWSELSDGAFDRAYWEWEARTGRCGVDALTVFREHASPALRQVIDGVLPEHKALAQEAARHAEPQL
jgi:hypothetical protein